VRIAVRFCSGCRPRADRNAVAAFIKSRIDGPHELVGPSCINEDIVVIVKGCDAACDDDKVFTGSGVRYIYGMEDARVFIREISEESK
jgi:hypothetical protein